MSGIAGVKKIYGTACTTDSNFRDQISTSLVCAALPLYGQKTPQLSDKIAGIMSKRYIQNHIY